MDFSDSFCMDNLLCDEDWLSSPQTPKNEDHPPPCKSGNLNRVSGFVSFTSEDFEQAVNEFLEKEMIYMQWTNNAGDFLQKKDLVNARFNGIQWFIKSASRLNLPFGVVFRAANYLDRYLSKDTELNTWMIELSYVACFSVATKFSESHSPTIKEIQMKDLSRSFESSMVQRMELNLSQALEWRVNPPTAWSFLELLEWNINNSMKPHSPHEIVHRMTELLLGALSDMRLMGFRPSVVALSALKCSLNQLLPTTSEAHLSRITRLLNQDQKDDLIRCYELMEAQRIDTLRQDSTTATGCGFCHNCSPSSPKTVLLKEERSVINDLHVDCSLFKASGPKIMESCERKRKRDQLL